MSPALRVLVDHKRLLNFEPGQELRLVLELIAEVVEHALLKVLSIDLIPFLNLMIIVSALTAIVGAMVHGVVLQVVQ